MTPSEKLLKGLFGPAGFVEFSQTLAKGETKHGKGAMGAYVPAMIAPRAVMSWLFKNASLMKSVDQKEFQIPGSNGYSVKLTGLDSLYNAELICQGKSVAKYECQYFEKGECVPDACGNFSALVKDIVHACNVRVEGTQADAAKALAIGKEVAVTASMGRLIDSLVKAADDQTSLTNKPVRHDTPMRAENDTSPGKNSSSKQPNEKFITGRMELAQIRAERIDPVLARRRPESEKVKEGEEAADGKTGTESIPKISAAAKKAEIPGASSKKPISADQLIGMNIKDIPARHRIPGAPSGKTLGIIDPPAHLGWPDQIKGKGKRRLRSLLGKTDPNPTSSPSPTASDAATAAMNSFNSSSGAGTFVHPLGSKSEPMGKAGTGRPIRATPAESAAARFAKPAGDPIRGVHQSTATPGLSRAGHGARTASDRTKATSVQIHGLLDAAKEHHSVLGQQRTMPKPNLPKSEPMGKAGMGVDKPGGAAIPKMPKMQQAPIPGAGPSKSPAASAAKQSMAAARGLSAPTKMSSSGKPKSMGFGPIPDSTKPNMGKQELLAKPSSKPAAEHWAAMKAARIGKSEGFVSEDKIYSKCEHCGQAEFMKSAEGPKFNPCACFVAMTKDDEGNPTHFVALRKSANGYSVTFDPSVDDDAKKVFLLTLKTRLLVKKKFGV